MLLLALLTSLSFLTVAMPCPQAGPAWPRTSTYQSFLKLPLVINVIHLVGPGEAQVVVIVHAGDAQALLLVSRGALDELEQEKVGWV